MTVFSGVVNNSNFDGKTILLECEDSKYVYISGLEIFEFRFDGETLEYIFLMGKKMIPCTLAVGAKYTYFMSTHYKLIENDKIQECMLLNSSIDSLDPFDYHVSKNGLDCFKKLLECNRIQSNWLSMECGDMEEIIEEVIEEVVEEDDNIHGLEYTDGSDDFGKVFNHNCVICLERDSDNMFKQCGHHCIFEECYQKSGMDI